MLDELADPQNRLAAVDGFGFHVVRSAFAGIFASPSINSSEKWHAVRCPPSPTGKSAGRSVRHFSRPWESWHRGWKGHPGGTLARSGGLPGMGRKNGRGSWRERG